MKIVLSIFLGLILLVLAVLSPFLLLIWLIFDVILTLIDKTPEKAKKPSAKKLYNKMLSTDDNEIILKNMQNANIQ